MSWMNNPFIDENVSQYILPSTFYEKTKWVEKYDLPIRAKNTMRFDALRAAGTILTGRPLREEEHVFPRDGDRWNCARDNVIVAPDVRFATLPSVSYDERYERWRVRLRLPDGRRVESKHVLYEDAVSKLTETLLREDPERYDFLKKWRLLPEVLL